MFLTSLCKCFVLICVRHGHFKKVLNPKLKETVHDMIADSQTLLEIWKNEAKHHRHHKHHEL